MPLETTTAEWLTRLSRLDCCAVSDAMDKLGLTDRVTRNIEQRSTQRRIVGQAITVKLLRADEVKPPAGSTPRHLGTTAIEMAGPGNVIVVEQRTGVTAGSWGGILTLGAKVRGVAGVVADGPVRDIDEARAYDFPIFCRSLTAITARARVAELDTNVAINVDGVQVHPGDLVIADASAVAFIPLDQAEAVIVAAEAIAGRESAMTKALLNGVPITQVMGADYEHMLR